MIRGQETRTPFKESRRGDRSCTELYNSFKLSLVKEDRRGRRRRAVFIQTSSDAYIRTELRNQTCCSQHFRVLRGWKSVRYSVPIIPVSSPLSQARGFRTKRLVVCRLND